MQRPSSRWVPPWLFWTLVLAVVTGGMLLLRDDLDQAHVALIYLMVVLGASASAGRAVGIGLACAGFALIDFFFQPPFDTLAIGKRPDWLVLIAFLATAAVATQLLARARAEAEGARRRAEEIDRLSLLGAETLSVGRAEEALGAIAHVIRDTIGVAVCEIFVLGTARDIAVRVTGADQPDADDASGASRELVTWVAANGRVAAEREDGSLFRATRPANENVSFDFALGDARALLVPLIVHERTVGVLRLAHTHAIALDPPQRRFLAALSYYAALGIERVRLVAEAEHAEALRLNRMVADLLELSRLNAGALPVRRELNAAEDLVGAAIQQVSGALNGREVRASIEWSEPVLVGQFDFVHSLRILVNLIENALKYSPADTPIDIEVRRTDGMLLITVADRGPGITGAERERIFDPFYRLIPGVSPDDGAGAGSGLAIARRLAEAQGGNVTYADRAGGGSCFTLELPASSIEEAAAVERVHD